MTLLRGYVCTGPDGFGGSAGAAAGRVIRRGRGLRVGPTVAAALRLAAEGERGWPPRTFAVEMLASALTPSEGGALRARSLRVDHEVPLRKVLGAGAEQIAPALAEAARVQWLRPRAGTPIEAEIEALVTEHFAALSEYMPVKPLPLRIVRSWQEARDVRGRAERLPARIEATRRACSVVGGTVQEGALRLAQHAALRVIYRSAWEAGWTAACTSNAQAIEAFQLTGLGEEEVLQAQLSACSVEGLSLALQAARAPAFEAAWRAALNLLRLVPDDLPPVDIMFAEAVRAAIEVHTAYWRRTTRHKMDGCPQCEALTLIRALHIKPMIEHNGVVIFQLGMEAVASVAERFGHILNDVQQPAACTQLYELFRLGAWPIGPSRGAFYVFLPQVTH